MFFFLFIIYFIVIEFHMKYCSNAVVITSNLYWDAKSDFSGIGNHRNNHFQFVGVVLNIGEGNTLGILFFSLLFLSISSLLFLTSSLSFWNSG